SGTRELLFGDRTALAGPVETVWPDRMASLSSGPEPACIETARHSTREPEPEIVPALAGLDAGTWSGRALDDVAVEDPDGVRAWLTDPTASPHGGESLAALVRRVGGYCDDRDWPHGRNVAVVAPLVAKAMAVHALGASPAVIFRLDLAPLSQVGLSRQSSGWRLGQLGPGR
ncbi:MAG TPA: histidine phosphatase family protein, partial [Propionibacteriaceae bacterium]